MEVHRCRFVDYYPSTINCLALNTDCTILAVARANGHIELWTVDCDYYFEKALFGLSRASVETLSWAPNNRLFSAGSHGKITEWDIDTCLAKGHYDSYGGAVLSIVIDPEGTLLISGCEDGHCKMYSIETELDYMRSFDKVKGKVTVVCCIFNKNIAYAGSSEGRITKFDISTGQAIQRITLDSPGGRRCIVWDLAVLNDLTMVSGDSLGRIQFWDGQFGTLLQSSQTHEADITALATNIEKTVIYCSGVDTNIVELSLLKGTEENSSAKWTKTDQIRAHTHDVRALVYYKKTLLSGGVDTCLITYSCPGLSKVRWRRIPPFPHQSPLCLAKTARILLYQFSGGLRFWALGKTALSENPLTSIPSGTQLSLESNLCLLLEFSPKTVSSIVCSAITSNAEFVSYSDVQATKLFRAHSSGQFFSLSKISKHCLRKFGSSKLLFSTDGARLFSVSFYGEITVMSLTTLKAEHVFRKSSWTHISHLALSSAGKYMAVCDALNEVEIFELSTFKSRGKLPKTEAKICALEFRPNSSELVAVCTCNRVYIFSADELMLTLWSRANSERFPPDYLRKNQKTIGIKFCESLPQQIFVYDHCSFSRIDLNYSMEEFNTVSFGAQRHPTYEKRNKKRRKDEIIDPSFPAGALKTDASDATLGLPSTCHQLKTITRFQPLLFFDFIGPGEAVAVERPWLDVVATFPPPFLRSRFGT